MAVTLPYTYKTVPSALPPSVTFNVASSDKSKYVVSSSGHAAHPNDIISSCKALLDHFQRTAEDAKRIVEEWQDGIKERDLAEKRRVAPGWLDREEKILEPTKSVTGTSKQTNLLDGPCSEGDSPVIPPAISPTREGEELDRAFGGLDIR